VSGERGAGSGGQGAGRLAYQGSLDPFEDIAQQLRALGVAFTLTVQMPDQALAHAWHNLEDFTDAGCTTATKAMAEMVSNARAIRAQRRGRS
jgi:hypothetical protein